MLKNLYISVQTFLHSIEYREVLKRAVKRTMTYAERALEASDAVIDESIYGAASFAGWQVNVMREV